MDKYTTGEMTIQPMITLSGVVMPVSVVVIALNQQQAVIAELEDKLEQAMASKHKEG